MKTLTCKAPFTLEYTNASEPTASKDYCTIKIKRIGICGTDLHAFEGVQPYFTYPRILGHEVAAEIEEVPSQSGFAKGEAVTIIPYFGCGVCIACRTGTPNCCVTMNVFGVHSDGGLREFVSVPLSALIHARGLPLDMLALIEPLSVGAHAIRRAQIKSGENVVVMGLGPIGLGALEFARLAGAKTIGVDINKERLSFCSKNFKVDVLISGTHQQVIQELRNATNGDMPDVIIDATGNLQAIQNGFEYMRHGGRYVLVGLQKGNISFSHPEFHKREGTLMSSRNSTREDFEVVINALREGSFDGRKFITHRVGFEGLKDVFGTWLDPATGVIKGIVEF